MKTKKNFISVVAVLAGALLFLRCESVFEVVNEGSITDAGLTTVAAIPPLTSGVAGDFSTALGGGGGTSFLCLLDATITDDAQHCGSSPNYREIDDPSTRSSFNQPALVNSALNGMYQATARARWVSDDAIRRIKSIPGIADTVWNRNANVAAILVYSGFVHLYLADYFDGAPVDGGPKLSRSQLWQRAIDRFNEAIIVGTNASNPALAGRVATSVGSTTGTITGFSGTEWARRAHAGLARLYRSRSTFGVNAADLAAAVTAADLAAPAASTTYRFDAIFSINSVRENNMWFWANLIRNEFSTSPDTRAEYALNPSDTRISTQSAGLGGDGTRPWWTQNKFTSYSTGIRVSGWQEMELIRAEERWVNADYANALAAINRVRSAVPTLTPRPTPTGSVRDTILAWLKYERRAEFLWEGRRMADLRYFGELGKVKATPAYFPIPSSERNTNPYPMD